MDFILTIESHLKDMNYQMAALEIMNPDNLGHIEQEGMELISKLCDIGLQAAVEFDDISTCSELLNYICNNYNPKLALVSTLEQAETFMFSPKFSIIMKAIQIVFSRHPSKRAATYSWTLELFNKHLQEYQKFPEGLKNKLTEGEDLLLVENDPKIRSIFDYYDQLYDFYVPIVKEFTLKCVSTQEGKPEVGKLGRVLTSSLVDLIGEPMIYFDLSLPPADEVSKSPNSPRKSRSRLQMKKPEIGIPRMQKSEARVIVERIMKQISQVNLDSSFLLKWTERKCHPQPELTELDLVDYDEEVEEAEFKKTAIANYFYLVYVEDLSPRQMSTTTTHLFHILLPLINVLLLEDKQNHRAIEKGLLLAQKLIRQITEPLTMEFLTGQVYSVFVEKLAQLVVYFDVRSTRELTLAILKSYFWKFDAAGRYMFFQFILVKVRHPGLLGYMIGQIKDCLALTLDKEGDNLEEMEFHFLGNNLAKLLFQICTLKDGATTDLLEMNDQIMAALNLVRFLLLRDGSMNKSGVLDEMPKIDALLLKPLRMALDLTKAHYVQRLKETQDPDYKGGDQEGVLVAATELAKTVMVGGQEIELDAVSTEDQVKAIKHGLCNIDIMESLLARVNECYSDIK